jgi:hypothetical protein
MSDWETQYYAVAVREDSLWEAAFDALPDQLGCQIERDFGVWWVAQTSEVEAVRMVLALGRSRVHSLGEGALFLSDWHRSEFLERFSESAGAKCQWHRLRLAHFATDEAQSAFEALL